MSEMKEVVTCKECIYSRQKDVPDDPKTYICSNPNGGMLNAICKDDYCSKGIGK